MESLQDNGDNDDTSICSVCRRDYAYNLNTSKGVKWIQISVCLLCIITSVKTLVMILKKTFTVACVQNVKIHKSPYCNPRFMLIFHITILHHMDPIFLLNTAVSAIHDLHIIKLNTFKIFYAISRGITELGVHSWNWGTTITELRSLSRS